MQLIKEILNHFRSDLPIPLLRRIQYTLSRFLNEPSYPLQQQIVSMQILNHLLEIYSKKMTTNAADSIYFVFSLIIF